MARGRAARRFPQSDKLAVRLAKAVQRHHPVMSIMVDATRMQPAVKIQVWWHAFAMKVSKAMALNVLYPLTLS